MKASNALSTLRAVSIALGMIVAFGIPTFGQEASPQNEASAPQPAPAMNEVLRHNIEDWALQGRGVPEDWSTHHLVFSNPGTEEDAIANGTHDRWLNIVNDPRYILQQMKRSTGVKAFADREIASLGQAAMTESIKKAKPKKGKLKKDWTVTLLGHGQVQPNVYPGKFSFSLTVANCSTDFVVYPTGVPGATGAANIIAYNELYGTNGPNTGCGVTATVPSVYWAYNTGGMVTTSPIISEGGSQVAFIQVTGTTASLVLLKWKANTGTLSAPVAPTAQGTASAYRSCAAPCSYTVSLGANDTYSAPFYDYLPDDAIYVGDDSGKLHKITGVFYGTTIAEASGGWPVTLNASYKTASPVYDNTSGYVFVGNIATGTNAALYAVGTGNAGTTNASIHATSSGLGDAIVDGTLVDPTTEKVYAFVTTDGTGHNGVYQFDATFASATAGTEKEVGFGGSGYYFYSGNFDNVYYSAASGAAGDLWVVGNTGGSFGGGGGGVNLYRIPIGAGNAMGTPVAAIGGLTAGVTQDSVANSSSSGNVSSLSWSHTVDTGRNVYLLVGLSYRVDNSGSGAGAGTFASSITANGTAMTCLVAISDNGTGSCGNVNTAGAGGEPSLRGEIWSLSLGTIASTTTESIVATINVANPANGTAIAGTSISYFGVGSVASGGDTDSNTVSATSASLAVTAAPGKLVVSNLALPKSSSSVSSQNALLSDVSSSGNSFANIQDGTSSAPGSNPTMGWTWTGSAPYSLTAAVLTPAAAPTAASYGWPSPLAEFCNGGLSGCTASGTATTSGTDYIFFSVDRLATATTNCGTVVGQGCVLAYSIDTPTTAPTLVGSAQFLTTATPGCWSTSGIVVDNSVPSGTLAGASQIYTLEFNGNGAGGPTEGTYTSGSCNNADAAAPIAFQGAQSGP